MKAKRKQRLLLIALLTAGIGTSIGLALVALKENINLFFSPTQVLAGKSPGGTTFRLGGIVVAGSVQRSNTDLTVNFVLTDTAKTVPVRYSGILPDLFREGQGIVAMGKMDGDVFEAEQVLAKHDENYMPPEVADSLKAAHESAKN